MLLFAAQRPGAIWPGSVSCTASPAHAGQRECICTAVDNSEGSAVRRQQELEPGVRTGIFSCHQLARTTAIIPHTE